MDNPDGLTKPVDLILTFRGIDVPTTEMFGKDACSLTFAQIVDGREQRPGPLLLAYQEGIIWRTCLPDVETGQFRLTLISNHTHCSQDVTIDDDVVAQRVLRVEFNRDECRRKWFPVFIKRLWWNLGDFLEKREDDPKRDQRVLSQYRRRFRRGPIGSWLSSHDNLMYGTSIEFRKDFTGTVCAWDCLGYDDASETGRDFQWQCVGDLSIDVQPVDGDLHPEEWGVLKYDFRVSRSAYGKRQVLMYSTDIQEIDGKERGFWLAGHAVTLVE